MSKVIAFVDINRFHSLRLLSLTVSISIDYVWNVLRDSMASFTILTMQIFNWKFKQKNVLFIKWKCAILCLDIWLHCNFHVYWNKLYTLVFTCWIRTYVRIIQLFFIFHILFDGLNQTARSYSKASSLWTIAQLMLTVCCYSKILNTT